MGWADPNKWAGLSPKKKRGWADLGPDSYLGRSRPNLKFVFSLGRDRPRHIKLGQQSGWPSPKQNAQREGRIIPPPPPACRTILHAGAKHLQLKRRGEEDCTWRGGGGGLLLVGG